MSGRAEHYSDKCEHGFHMERCRQQDAAIERSALERAAQFVDDEDEGRTGRGFELGDVGDFRKRCVAGIRALASPAAAPAAEPAPLLPRVLAAMTEAITDPGRGVYVSVEREQFRALAAELRAYIAEIAAKASTSGDGSAET